MIEFDHKLEIDLTNGPARNILGPFAHHHP
jgi:hypothetical protein